MQQVIDGLWIGDYQASQDADLLSKNGIECIVSASSSPSLSSLNFQRSRQLNSLRSSATGV